MNRFKKAGAVFAIIFLNVLVFGIIPLNVLLIWKDFPQWVMILSVAIRTCLTFDTYVIL